LEWTILKIAEETVLIEGVDSVEETAAERSKLSLARMFV
jgi:hypothetical protein